MDSLDETCFRAVYGGPAGGSWGAVMLAFTLLGSGWAMLALVPLLAAPRTRGFAAALTATLVTTAALVFVLKASVRRVRPCATLDGVVAAVARPTDFSFPSGHAAGSFAFAAFVATVLIARHRATRPRARGPLASVAVAAWTALLLASAACVALSRVYLGVHFPGDVAAGALLGAMIGAYGGRAYVLGVRPFARRAPSP